MALAGAPAVHVLATSREPLAVDGEVQWSVPPLQLPPPAIENLDAVAATEAVQLFVERAGQVRPFVLDADTAPAVTALCRHLDGLPLAIELAAASTKALPVSHIVDALDDRFGVLVSPSRTAHPRQRTLRATIDWSYQLLDPVEQTMFALLSVFDGGWTLESGRAVAAAGGVDPERTLDLIVGLVDKSLVQTRLTDDRLARYDMMETLREYGRERLGAGDLLERARRGHRAYFVEFVRRGNLGLMSSEHRRWQRRVEVDYGNIRAAFGHAVAGGDWSDALAIAASLWRFWGTSQRQAEGRSWLEPLLAALHAGADRPGVAPKVVARALSATAYLAGQQGDDQAALSYAQAAVDVAAP